MKFAVHLPNIQIGSDPARLGELAREAEAASWDGAFVWDAGALGPDHADYADAEPAIDVWTGFAAMALSTERLRFGPLVAPLPRHRPWELTRRIVSLDHLSRGRFTLVAGPGADTDGFFARVGEPTSRAARRERLEEGLAIVAGLQSGEPFSYAGTHYRVRELTLLPRPLQRPRIPIWRWAGAASPATVRRALPWDGAHFWLARPRDIAAVRATVSAERGTDAPFEISVESRLDRASPEPPPDSDPALVRRFAEAGATWWLESTWKWAEPPKGSYEGLVERIRRGPPRG